MPRKKVVPLTESTQLDLKRELENDPNLGHLSYVQALEQTEGRGRQGNRWISKAGNLYLSVLYRLDGAGESLQRHLTWLPLWVGAQVRSALVELGLSEDDIQVKWPNDLCFRSRAKVGGILCEKTQSNVIIGIGLNVAHSPAAELEAEGRVVTSLVESGVPSGQLQLDAIRDAILRRLEMPFDIHWLKVSLSRNLIPRVGDEVEWVDHTLGAARRSGIVMGLGGFGELHVSADDGIAHLFSEEVSLKRY